MVEGSTDHPHWVPCLCSCLAGPSHSCLCSSGDQDTALQPGAAAEGQTGAAHHAGHGQAGGNCWIQRNKLSWKMLLMSFLQLVVIQLMTGRKMRKMEGE